MRATVTDVEVRAVPFADDEEERWDLFSGPDLYCEIYGPSGDCLHTSDVVRNVRPADLPVTLDAEIVFAPAGPHVLRLLDADLAGSEVVGRVAFEPERLAEAGRGTEPPRCVQFQDGKTILQLDLTWPESP